MESRRITFEGSMGRLAGVLELPESVPRATCLFAHCFTCSKDFKAAVRIARSLQALGFAVLRFDFTGIGQSDGDFAETTFTSNIDDLVAAAAYLDTEHDAPGLLVGHSLGGTAALAAAHRIPSALAVATIGSPAGTEHLRATLLRQAPELADTGEASVEIAGRSFRVRAQLLEDLGEHSVISSVQRLGRPLMVFHSPADTVVSIEQATILFRAAHHPKSFVSVDGADHLLLRDPRDAEYIGGVLAAWAARYV